MEKKIITTLKIPFVWMIIAIMILIITPPFISARTQPNKGGNNNHNGDDPFGLWSGIPGFGGGGGEYRFVFGGPSQGYSRGGVIWPITVCDRKGPCYKKRLTCPAKCFTSYSHSGKGYGGGGDGDGCTVDCEKNCVAYC